MYFFLQIVELRFNEFVGIVVKLFVCLKFVKQVYFEKKMYVYNSCNEILLIYGNL